PHSSHAYHESSCCVHESLARDWRALEVPHATPIVDFSARKRLIDRDLEMSERGRCLQADENSIKRIRRFASLDGRDETGVGGALKCEVMCRTAVLLASVLAALVAAALSAATAAVPAPMPVLVELFTSEGCS